LGYFHHFSDHDTPIQTTVTLPIPRSGTASWIDPTTGTTLSSAPVTAGMQTLKTPDFVVDLALKIRLD